MKNHLKKHLVSFTILAFFLILATSSEIGGILDFIETSFKTDLTAENERIRMEQYVWNSIWEDENMQPVVRQVEQIGGQDKFGRWDETIRFEHRYKNPLTTQWETRFIEESPIKGGKRHGKAKLINQITFEETFICYDMGVRITCSGFMTPTNRKLSAFEQLEMDSPWFLYYWLSPQGNFVELKNFVTGIEAQLSTYSFEPNEFDEYYSQALDDLEDEGKFLDESDYYQTTVYFSGITFLKDFEFRRAIVDRYDDLSLGTFQIIQATYPDFAQAIYAQGINETAWMAFCNDFDQKMDELDILDPKDLYFLDSIDNRMYRIMDSFLNEEFGPGTVIAQFLHSGPKFKLTDLQETLKHGVNKGQLRNGTSNKEIAEVVAYLLLLKYGEGDLIKSAVKKAWFKTKDFPVLATLVTESIGDTSPTSVKVRGNIIDDGGTAVTEHGFVWGDKFNPTIQSNTITLGSGTGELETIISNLIEGDHYFVRTYAINSVGVAYGNVAEFTAGAITNTMNTATKNIQLRLFPNPASHNTVLTTQTPLSETAIVTLYDLKGVAVFQKLFSWQNNSGQQHILDLSTIPTGLYFVNLSDGKQSITKKLVIE